MKKAVFTGLAAAAVASVASADYTDVATVSYSVTAADFGGASVTVNVTDVYLVSNDMADTLLNIYNWNTANGAASYWQSMVSTTGWIPNNAGSIFDTPALQQADSFVTVGSVGTDSLQAPGVGAGIGLDPSFGGQNAAAPNADAGWYNGSPPSLAGAVKMYDNGIMGTMIARFSTLGDAFTLEGTAFEATWNQGLGTDGQQAAFFIPAPGAMALLGLAGVVGRRRRG